MNEQKEINPLPSGFTNRPALLDDAEMVSEMLNVASLHAIGEADEDADLIKSAWQSVGFEPAQDTRLVFAPNGQLVGYIEVWGTVHPPVHPFLWGRVHPQFEGQGVGSWMMDWAEGRVQELAEKVPAHLRISFKAGHVDTYQPANQFLQERGMVINRRFWKMVIELDGEPPQAVFPPHITLRTYADTQELLPIIRAWDESFSDHWGHQPQSEEKLLASWQQQIATDKLHDPTLWFLAMDGDEIAGFSLCDTYAVEDPEMGWIGRLGVRRNWRKQGIGLGLLKHSFAEFMRRGHKRVGLGVDATNLTGATRLYENAGMFISHTFNTYEKEVRAGIELATETIDS